MCQIQFFLFLVEDSSYNSHFVFIFRYPMDNSMKSALLQSNNEFVQPKPAKKPRVDYVEDEEKNEAKLLGNFSITHSTHFTH